MAIQLNGIVFDLCGKVGSISAQKILPEVDDVFCREAFYHDVGRCRGIKRVSLVASADDGIAVLIESDQVLAVGGIDEVVEPKDIDFVRSASSVDRVIVSVYDKFIVV